ncbi:MAG: adenylate/guanylate cyclase domain-containing protein [Deltaproteobacteria bacterium]|nr:adenylate/guanylate cyclase domain-containing protein [Deltaproteobacteria bacterium]
MNQRDDETIPYPQDVAKLMAVSELARAADVALERAMQARLPLAETLDQLLPLLCEHTGAEVAFAETFDEDLQLRRYLYQRPDAAVAAEAIEGALSAVTKGGATVVEGKGWTLIAQRLDVAGEDFGSVGMMVSGSPEIDVRPRLRALLEAWCEEVDGYVAALARARRKHQLTCRISDALKEPVLEEGIACAVAALHEELAFERLLVAYRPDQGHGALHYLVFSGAEVLHRSSSDDDPELRAFLLERGRQWILEGDDEVAHRLGISRSRQEVLINGVRDAQVVGRVVVGFNGRAFNTFDCDLLERFADYLRQRIVDFNKEWSRLSLCFPSETVVRMLAHSDYSERYLQPREEFVAMMFCDISGFTWVSEQVLKEPKRIGALIDRWGRRVVEQIWQTGGVFDKMVGDCVIGLWSPPFFEWSADECCERALSAAQAIRDITREIGEDRTIFSEPLPRPLGVATGINYGSLFVGQFGPNDDYTGFSAEMNNAR